MERHFNISISHEGLAREADLRAQAEDAGLNAEQEKAALLVNLYQDEPILNQAFRFLQKLMDIDELMTQWRHRHALMVRHL